MDSSTIVGVLLGAAIAVIGSLATVAGGYFASRKREHKDDLRRAAAAYLIACDRLWSAESGVRMAAYTSTKIWDREDSSLEQREQAEQNRIEAFARHSEANWDARRIRYEIQLVESSLSQAADSLYDSCSMRPGEIMPMPTTGQQEAHTMARSDFMTAARRAI